MICDGAGPLGRTVRWPGPITMYSWNSYAIPPWMVEALREDVGERLSGLEAAVIESILTTAVPHRDRLEWGPEDEVRFGA